MSAEPSAETTTTAGAAAANIATMFFDRVEKSAQLEAFRYLDGGKWTSLTWQQAAEQVEALAAGRHGAERPRREVLRDELVDRRVLAVDEDPLDDLLDELLVPLERVRIGQGWMHGGHGSTLVPAGRQAARRGGLPACTGDVATAPERLASVPCSFPKADRPDSTSSSKAP